MARPVRKRVKREPSIESGDLSSSPTLQPTSSLSALGARFHPYDAPSTSTSSPPPADPLPEDEIEPCEMNVDDESQESIASAGPGPASSLPPPNTALASVSLAPTPIKKEESRDSIVPDEPVVKAEVKHEDDIVPPPPTPSKPETIDLSSSSPVKPTLPSSSAPKRRSPEEQAALKVAARKRLEATKLGKVTASASALTESLKKEREEKRRALAAKHLGAFGFTIKSEASSGMTRFGTGRGGDAPPPTPAPGPLGAMGFESAPAPPEVWEPNPLCSEEQLKVLDEVRQGKKVFFTGSAGVGKSFLLSEIQRLLNFVKRPYQICATTGIAALQVNGTTLHSWAGIGLGKDSVMTLYDKITIKKEKRTNWIDTQVLIIDEISMIDPGLFTKLNLLGKLIRQNAKPFGGIQIIVSGDFFQLPPVPEKHPLCPRCGQETFNRVKLEKSTLHYEDTPAGVELPEIRKCVDSQRNGEVTKGCQLEQRNYRFAFESETWAECDFQVMELTKVFRQSDPGFINMLEKFRRGICDQPCIDLLASCGTALNESGSIKPTNLYPLRASVDRENESEFKKLEGKAFNFEAADDSRGPRGESAMRERLKDVPGQPKLHLKLGAQVLLLTNLEPESGLVNGSRGVIVDWIRASEARQQETAMPGPARRKGAAGAGFGGEEWRAKAADEWVEKQGDDMLPVVFWACGATKTVHPFCWVIDVDKDNTVARTQLPLQLAWALTIHKSQGQSLDAVGVRLNGTFEKGQAYVALSRCRTPAGMKVEGFRANLVMAHPTVMAFYDRIKLGLPFRQTPPPFINPLSFVPDFSPLIAKTLRIFGRAPPPFPLGTALGNNPANGIPAPLAQPQFPPPPPSPVSLSAPSAIPFRLSAPVPLPSPFSALPPPLYQWETLLRQSIEAFKTGGGATSAVFLDQARQLVARAFDDAPVGPSGVKAEELEDDDDEEGGESGAASEGHADRPGESKRRKTRTGREGDPVGH